MASEEDKKGAHAPTGGPSSSPESSHSDEVKAEPTQEHPSASGHPAPVDAVETEYTTGTQPGHATVSYTPTVDDSYGSYDDPYGYDVHSVETTSNDLVPAVQAAAPPPPPPPPPADEEEVDEEDEGMLRMSFLGHLEDLRKHTTSQDRKRLLSCPVHVCPRI